MQKAKEEAENVLRAIEALQSQEDEEGEVEEE